MQSIHSLERVNSDFEIAYVDHVIGLGVFPHHIIDVPSEPSKPSEPSLIAMLVHELHGLCRDSFAVVMEPYAGVPTYSPNHFLLCSGLMSPGRE